MSRMIDLYRSTWNIPTESLYLTTFGNALTKWALIHETVAVMRSN